MHAAFQPVDWSRIDGGAPAGGCGCGGACGCGGRSGGCAAEHPRLHPRFTSLQVPAVDEDPPEREDHPDWFEAPRWDDQLSLDEWHDLAVERAEERAKGEHIEPICPEEPLVVAWARDASSLRDRCRINIGNMRVGGANVSLSTAIPKGYQPKTSRKQMFRDFLGDYMAANRVDWDDLAENIKGDDTPGYKGCFWDSGGGMLYRATLHALQMIACTTMPASVSDGLRERFVAVRDKVRSGTLNVVLSIDARGGDERSAIVVGPAGEVTAGFIGSGTAFAWEKEKIWLGQMLTANALLADYLLWWAWRLHSSADENYSDARYYTGLGCARLALAELGFIASLLLHEDVHRDIDPHCQFDDGSPTGCPHKKLQVLGLGRFATKFNLPPTFTRLSTSGAAPFNTMAFGRSAGRIADGQGDAWHERRVTQLLALRCVSTRDPLFQQWRVAPSGATDNSTGGLVDCDQGTGVSYASTTFVLGRSQSVATLATPASCSKAGANAVVTVPL